MWNSGIIASRHRGEYYLALNGFVNNDYLRIDPNDVDLNIPTTGDYFIECEIDTTRLDPLGGFQPIIGRGTSGNTNQQYGFQIDNSNRLVFWFGLQQSLRFNNFVNTYPNQLVKIKGEWHSGGARLLINELEVLTTTDTSRPSDSGGWFFVNGVANSTGENFPRTDLQGDLDIYNFSINNKKWIFPEGKGFVTKSNEFDVSTGLTDNAGGLTYWNNNVWQLITP